jgi:hypothetical protein
MLIIDECVVCFWNKAKAGLELNTLDEQRLKKIQELEHFERPHKEDVEAPQQKPVFITPLNRFRIFSSEMV